jgi:hypothetical protein
MESKQVHRSHFHLLQNPGCVKGQDKRQAALDASRVSPTTTSPSGFAKLASLNGILVSGFVWASLQAEI